MVNVFGFHSRSIDSVTKAVSDADRRRITQLEKTEASLRNEMTKLKDIAEVASSQARALDAQQASRDKEVLSLRQQLLDFQAQSDEKTVIGEHFFCGLRKM